MYKKEYHVVILPMYLIITRKNCSHSSITLILNYPFSNKTNHNYICNLISFIINE